MPFVSGTLANLLIEGDTTQAGEILEYTHSEINDARN